MFFTFSLTCLFSQLLLREAEARYHAIDEDRQRATTEHLQKLQLGRQQAEQQLRASLAHQQEEDRETHQKELNEAIARETSEREARDQAIREKDRLEAQVRKLKQTTFRWRVDYQRETQERYNRLLVDQEERLRAEAEEARKQLLEEQEAHRHDILTWAEKVCILRCLSIYRRTDIWLRCH